MTQHEQKKSYGTTGYFTPDRVVLPNRFPFSLSDAAPETFSVVWTNSARVVIKIVFNANFRLPGI